MERSYPGAGEYTYRTDLARPHTVVYHITNAPNIEFSIQVKRSWEGSVRPSFYPFIARAKPEFGRIHQDELGGIISGVENSMNTQVFEALPG
jgi:hypothetical protein